MFFLPISDTSTFGRSPGKINKSVVDIIFECECIGMISFVSALSSKNADLMVFGFILNKVGWFNMCNINLKEIYASFEYFVSFCFSLLIPQLKNSFSQSFFGIKFFKFGWFKSAANLFKNVSYASIATFLLWFWFVGSAS